MSTIRLGHPDDFSAIQEVELSAGQLFRGTHMDWAVGQATGLADLAQAAAHDMLWVAETEGELSGFMLAEAFGSDFHIREVSVAQVRQGRGIGRVLIETALAEAARRGFARATLTTDRTLAWNAPWYERLGFAIVPADDIIGRLATQLASERDPHRRCAMIRLLG